MGAAGRSPGICSWSGIARHEGEIFLSGPPDKAAHDKSRSAFSRMAKNMGWIAGSRGFNSVVSIAYLAIAARSLGPAGFGRFALILTYAQLIANFVQFQSWKGVIRYGALHLTAQRQARLERLFGFTAMLDFGSAIAGALIAIICVPLGRPRLPPLGRGTSKPQQLFSEVSSS